MPRVAIAYWLITLIGVPVWVQPTSAQSTGSNAPVRDPQALALLAQCSANMRAALINDTYATGTITRLDSRSGPSAIVTQTKGIKIRNDITDADGQRSFSLDGTGGWAQHSGRITPVPYSAVAYYRPEYVPALACVLDPLRSNMNVQYVGLELVGTRTAHHIQFSVPPKDQDDSESLISDFHVFLDQQTLIVLKTRNYVFDPIALENRSVWETYYSDYRVVNGALLPFHIENYLAGQKVTDIVFASVQTNQGISDAVFSQ